ncbi:MAG: hypothetical protein JWQ40_4461 [Segetibacter sp.]|nr:hypothetical protein [Segetibacter sp.]
MATVDQSFLGTGWGFPPSFRREFYGVEMLVGEDDVRSSLQIILLTITGERVMLPTFGCNLQPHVFDQMNPPNIALIEKIVKEALVLHEPRITVENLVSTPDDYRGVLEIHIEYKIIATNTRYNYVFPFYINEATNIEK